MWTRLWNKLRFLLGRERLDPALSEELEFHRAMLEHDMVREGADRATATVATHRKLGNLATAHEDSRDAWIVRWLDELARDIRLAWRGYRRTPTFTAAAVATLALGLGANMAIFRFVDAVMLETLPVANPHELVSIGPGIYSYPTFRELEPGTRDVFAATAAMSTRGVTLTADGRSEILDAELVSGRYFEMLGVKPVLGRVLAPIDDGAEGAHPVCVISYGLWQRAFGGDRNIIGRIVRLNQMPFEVVGVTERGFEGAALHTRRDLQIPTSMTAALNKQQPRDEEGRWWLQVMARLGPGVSRDQAQATVRTRFQQPNLRVPLELWDGKQGLGSLRRQFEDPVLVAQTLSALIFLIACANVVGLLLARTSARGHEIAVRRSLGASRGRVIVQFALEAAGLTLLGGLIAVGLAVALDAALVRMLSHPNSVLRLGAGPSSYGWLGMLGLLLVTTLAIGLVPALTATRRPVFVGLRETVRVTVGSGRLRSGLLISQIATCLVLVFGAGLLGSSLRNLRSIEPGLDADRVVVLSASARRSGYPPEREQQFYSEWLKAAQRTPGVESSSLASIAALSGGMFSADIVVPGAEAKSRPAPNHNFNIVTPDYFRTVGLPVVLGRIFADQDDGHATPVAVVNERFASHYWPGESAVGRRFKGPWNVVTIVGVVRTAKYQSIREQPQITVYLPLAQRPSSELTLHARVAATAAGVPAALVRAAAEVDPDVPVYGAATLSDYIDADFGNERALNLLSLLFGALALIVAASGLYGMVAYDVTRRTREVGLRMAIGAERRDVLVLFLKGALLLIALGIGVGIPVALAVGRQFSTVLYGVEPTSAPILSGATALLALVAIVAVLVPAIRAARLNPTQALKEP